MNIKIGLTLMMMIVVPHVATAVEIQSISGNIFVVRDGINLLARNGMDLSAGDVVSAGVGASAVISYDSTCKIPLDRDLIVAIADRSPCAAGGESQVIENKGVEPQPQTGGESQDPAAQPPSAGFNTTLVLGAAAIGGIAAVVIGSSGGGGNSAQPASP